MPKGVDAVIAEAAAQESPVEYGGGIGDKIRLSKWWLWKEVLGYEPHDVQLPFHLSMAAHRAWYAGKRLGKSRSVAMEMVPILLTPGTRTWLVGPRYESVVREWEYVHDAVLADVGVKQSSIKRVVCNPRQGDIELSLVLRDPVTNEKVMSSLVGKSGREPESLQAEELDCAVLCEATFIRDGIWTREVRPRLMTRGGISLWGSAPHGTANWVHRTYERWNQGALKDYGFFGIGKHAGDNPYNLETIDPAEMSEAEYREVVLGIPTPKVGAVYDRQPLVVNLNGKPPKGGGDIVLGVDFGYVHPHAAVFGCVQDERLFIWREYRRSKKTIDSHIRAYKRILKKREVEACVADPAGAGDRAALRRELDLPMKKVRKDVLPGISTVQRVIEQGRLIVDESCKGLLGEFATYEWAADAAGLPIERPVKRDDDLLDALRYLVVWLVRRNYI